MATQDLEDNGKELLDIYGHCAELEPLASRGVKQLVAEIMD